MAGALTTAAQAFERTLEELGMTDDDLDDAAELGRRGALLAAADPVWTKRLGPVR